MAFLIFIPVCHTALTSLLRLAPLVFIVIVGVDIPISNQAVEHPFSAASMKIASLE
jgi:hypothetical protein